MPARFLQVDENLFRGGEPSAEDLEMLRNIWNVGKIVSLDGKIGDSIHPHCKRLGLQHAIIPIGDGHSPNVKVLQDNLYNIFEMGRDDPEDERVYVHCLHGKDRTGMAVAMYRIMRGTPPDKALQEAYYHGMGRGLSPLTRHSYFSAVRDFAANKKNDIGRRGGYCDVNNTMDAAEVVRDEMNTSPVSGVSAPPGRYINDQTVSNPDRQSFPPTFQEGETPLGIRSASAKLVLTLFRMDSPAGILKADEYWFTSQREAAQYAKGKKMWKAEVSSLARVLIFRRPLDAAAMRKIQQEDPQIIVFPHQGRKMYWVRDTNGLDHPEWVDVPEHGDVNDSDSFAQVGQLYQYPGGSVPWGPSSGGGSLPAFEGGDTPTGGGAGSSGFAGVVLPFGGGFQSS